MQMAGRNSRLRRRCQAAFFVIPPPLLRAPGLVARSSRRRPRTRPTDFGALGYDFVVIDEEHAPIDRAMTDVMLLAARAGNLAGIVRVSSDDPVKILSCCGLRR